VVGDKRERAIEGEARRRERDVDRESRRDN
jgi:hypothetical protein